MTRVRCRGRIRRTGDLHFERRNRTWTTDCADYTATLSYHGPEVFCLVENTFAAKKRKGIKDKEFYLCDLCGDSLWLRREPRCVFCGSLTADLRFIPQ